MSDSYDIVKYDPEKDSPWVHLRSFEVNTESYIEALCYLLYESVDSDYPVVMFATTSVSRRALNIYVRGDKKL